MRFSYIIAIGYCLVLQTCSSQQVSEKINGVSYVASRIAVDSTHTKPITLINANYAAVMPFGFIRNLSDPTIIYNTDRQWYGETIEGADHYIEELRKHNIKIMLKPQLWIWQGEFTGHLTMNTEDDWQKLEESYSRFILEYAELAQNTRCEILCIGTELESFITERPEYWQSLILEIKNLYKGKLTYAANWDEFKRTPFWDKLDYVGIDAYFPVSDSKTPTVEECIKGWEQHIGDIESISDKYDKPVLFTEYGYRSMDYTAKEPWNSDHEIKGVNLEAQMNATEALFKTFWEESWFAGGFIWKWFHQHDEVGGREDNQFTPQNKPVEDVIQSFYSRSFD